MAWFRCIGSGGGSLKLRTATGNIANFETNLKSKLNSCKCTINPLQSGTGTPSPDNVRPISGFSALNVTLADGDMQTVESKTVDFGQTVYGGVLDVTNGKLTITHKLVTYSGEASENWQFINPSYYIASPTDCRKSQTVKANQYNGVAPTYYNVMVNGNIALSTVLDNLLIRNDSITSVADFKTALSGTPLQVLYELATPTEITLTPKQIEAVVGINNVYHDCNGQIEVKYLVRE